MERVSWKAAAVFVVVVLIGLATAYSQPTAPFFRVSPDGKVGVGTANPGYRLDVVGDINLTGCVRKGNTVLAGAPCVDSAVPPQGGDPGGPDGGGLPGRVVALERQLREMAAQMAALQRRVSALEARR